MPIDPFGDFQARIAAMTPAILRRIAETPELADDDLIFDDESPAYAEATRLWEVALAAQPVNLAILRNAGRFHQFVDADRAVALFTRGEQLDPTSHQWALEIGAALEAEARDAEALVAYERCVEHCTDAVERRDVLATVARLALHVDLHPRATEAAALLVAPGAPRDHPWHHAHAILGRLALLRDDVAAAGAHLDAAGLPDEPGLAGRTPDYYLVGELFDRGEREAVRAYLDAVATWTDDALQVASFRADLDAHESPRFPRFADERRMRDR
ncbi:MAG: hypothetical protein NT062_02535 [Proteobacteria bacterium]|nr:hypothetical protein [Pseudomonadota bacterium]